MRWTWVPAKIRYTTRGWTFEAGSRHRGMMLVVRLTVMVLMYRKIRQALLRKGWSSRGSTKCMRQVDKLNISLPSSMSSIFVVLDFVLSAQCNYRGSTWVTQSKTFCRQEVMKMILYITTFHATTLLTLCTWIVRTWWTLQPTVSVEDAFSVVYQGRAKT